ncbi:activated Cdc42 kinase-like [Stegodyphus dumicola]|uniref:activated Cdc42 kinase-like n=1 Tax=Stegodyphus dumicola TaxID=202533 RepID=UPI0015AEB351|nr:activated Cdc42 kinase-like [Stegodyphus dumicola]
MTKPEMRRLKKYFQKYCPHTYLRKIKKMILPKNKDDCDRTSIYFNDNTTEKNNIKVPSKHIIPKDNIVINKELGVGEFGVVQQGVWTNEDGERIQVAIKCLSEERMQKNHMEFLKEAAIMHTIDHENIVRLYGVVLETNALMLVTELAPLRSLLECLKEPALRPSFPVISLCEFALQICDGMQYLENKKLIHRDLAARNILVFAKNQVKISDFGLSRALGVGKDYYQTNFNVNLKLPIAWCAPECINYLRFTSASDVWAYGVTLWEMFSYGFQPWAALTGQQILEAIDEPNFQRLEQPECCPKEYYTLMLKCWQHDANKRPKFSEIYAILPECKPEQVQAVQDSIEVINGPKPKKDWLHYQTGEVITVLDKRPLPDNSNLWKGVLSSGKTGLFNPAHTVAYLASFPTNRPSFSRSDSKCGIYASRRRLRTDMISRPQGDFKHTGHVGLDGAFFGDISFLGDKYHQLPKQIVTPYKPQDDKENVSPTLTTLSDSSDKIPLLKKFSTSDGRSGSSSDNWSEVISDQSVSTSITNCVIDGHQKRGSKDGEKLINLPDHEYHEISDEEDFGFIENSKFESLDFGPSLMDEVFKALGSTKSELNFGEQEFNENNNIKNEIKEITSKVSREGSKKKQPEVKPISAADQQTLDSAIAIAKELANKSFLDLETRSDNDTPLESPKTPTSPFKRKFSFKFKTSPKPDRRNFSEEAEAIPDIQDIITEEAKEAYNSLVEKGSGLERSVSLPPTVAPKPVIENLPRSRQPLQTHTPATDSSDPESEAVDSNPLRMLRSGVPVRPKVRGNRHGIPNSGRAATPHTATVARLAANAVSSNGSSLVNGTRSNLGSPPPPPQAPKTFPRPNIPSRYTKDNNISNSSPKSDEVSSDAKLEDQSDTSSTNTTVSCSESSSDNLPNPLPLPPRDRTKPLPVLKHHQRKHPLILPGSNISVSDTVRNLTKQVSCPDVPSHSFCSVPEPERRSSEGAPPVNDTLLETATTTASSLTCNTSVSLSSTIPPPKPARTYNLDDSFEKEIQAEIDSLDNIPEEESQIMYKGGDHVSCEDLLEFALDKPNARRTQGRSQGIDSDEVRIMQKVLAKELVTPEECLVALNETDWDMHKAIKYMRLQCILNSHMIPLQNLKQTLVKCSWDVRQAANYLLATHNVNEDTTEV